LQEIRNCLKHVYTSKGAKENFLKKEIKTNCSIVLSKSFVGFYGGGLIKRGCVGAAQFKSLV